MRNREKVKRDKFCLRKKRVRAKIFGTAIRPRLNVSRSLKHLYLQIIDDDKGVTLVSLHDREVKGKNKLNKLARAKSAGLALAKKALAKKIQVVVFDRGGRPFHGRIKAVAEGAREGGLKF